MSDGRCWCGEECYDIPAGSCWCEEIYRLKIRAEDAELLAERRKWGAEEMDRLRARVQELEKEVEAYASIVDGCEGSHDGWHIITDEQIDEAWKALEHEYDWYTESQIDIMREVAFGPFNIHRFAERGSKGWVIGGKDE